MARRLGAAVTATLWLVAGCSGDAVTEPTPPSVTPPPTVTFVVIRPVASTLVSIGQVMQLSAVAADQHGVAIAGRSFEWSSSDEAVVTVTTSGEITAIANGTTTVSATADGVSGEATIRVEQVAATLAFVTQPTDVLGGSLVDPAVELEVLDALGTRVEAAVDVSVELEANPYGAVLSGTTTTMAADGVASFPDLGVEGLARDLTILASAASLPIVHSRPFDALSGLPAVQARSSTRGLTISGIGETYDVQLHAEDANGDPTLPPATVWSSRNPDIATVTPLDPASGRITALRDGQVGIVARADVGGDEVLVTVLATGATDPVTWRWGDFNANRLESVWAASPADVWAAGFGGTILHYDGVQWSDVSPGLTSDDLTSVWSSGPSDVWVGVRGGQLLHYDGSSWRLVDLEAVGALHIHAIWGTGPEDVWAVGYSDLARQGIFYFDGTQWSNALEGAGQINTTLDAVWGSGSDDVWAVGAKGGVLHFDGDRWSESGPPGLTDAVRDVFGSGADDVWVILDHAAWHYDGNVWTNRSHQLSTTPTQRLKAGWSNSPTSAWVTPVNGTSAWHFDGRVWSRVPVPWTINGASAVHGTGPSDAWIVAQWGEIAHYDGIAWTIDDLRLTLATPTAVWGSAANDIWASSRRDGMLHYNGDEWSVSGELTGWSLLGMWGSASDDVWAVGRHGTVVRYDGSSWTLTETALTPGDLVDVWGSRPDDVWTVSSQGAILRWDGARWSSVDPPVAVTRLGGVWGTSDADVWFAGEHEGFGVVLHFDGTSISDRAPPPSSPQLKDIWGTGPDDVWAVGSADALLHFDGTSWLNAAPGLSGYFHEVWGTGPDDVFALGGIGGCCPRWAVSIVHFDGVAWTDVTPSLPTWNAVTGLWGTRESALWAWGSAGTLLRGTR